MKVLLTKAMRAEIAAGGRAGATMMRIAEFYVSSYETMYPGIAGCGLHDPLAAAIAEDRSLATIERMCVDVELAGQLTRGQTVADRQRPRERRRVPGRRRGAVQRAVRRGDEGRGRVGNGRASPTCGTPGRGSGLGRARIAALHEYLVSTEPGSARRR